MVTGATTHEGLTTRRKKTLLSLLLKLRVYERRNRGSRPWSIGLSKISRIDGIDARIDTISSACGTRVTFLHDSQETKNYRENFFILSLQLIISSYISKTKKSITFQLHNIIFLNLCYHECYFSKQKICDVNLNFILKYISFDDSAKIKLYLGDSYKSCPTYVTWQGIQSAICITRRFVPMWWCDLNLKPPAVKLVHFLDFISILWENTKSYL